MRNKKNVINTIPPTLDYPMGRIQDDLGNGTGTPIVEANNGDIQETVTYFMETAKIVPNELPDNVTNGYQIASAIKEVGGKFGKKHELSLVNGVFEIGVRLDNLQPNDALMAFTDVSDLQLISRIKDVNGAIYDLDLKTTTKRVLSTELLLLSLVDGKITINQYVGYDAINSMIKANDRVLRSGKEDYVDGAREGLFVISFPDLTPAEYQNAAVYFTLYRTSANPSVASSSASFCMTDFAPNMFRVAFSDFEVSVNPAFPSAVSIVWEIRKINL